MATYAFVAFIATMYNCMTVSVVKIVGSTNKLMGDF